jgi:hypothetical protein
MHKENVKSYAKSLKALSKLYLNLFKSVSVNVTDMIETMSFNLKQSQPLI